MTYAICALFLVCGFILGRILARESWHRYTCRTCYHFDECARYGCADGSGGIRPLNVLEYASGIVPPPRAGTTDDEWICIDFIEAVRQAFREAGAVEVKDGHEAMVDGFAFIVGYHGHAYVVEPDFGVFRSTRGYEVIGCGAPYARGSLHMTEGTYAQRGTPEARIRVALETSEYFNAGVKGPFTVVRGGLTDGR